MVENGVDALTRQLGNISVSDDNRRNPPYINLRDAAETILPFDGKNMPISQFLNSCIHAKNMVSPNAEYGLVQMIKNKLFGPAMRVALSGEYNDIDSLLAVLRTRFAPVYSSSQLHGDLSKIMQHPDESVVDYSSRVSMILQQLKSCYQTENPTNADQFLNSAETNAIRNFLTGLKSDIYARIYPRDSVTLNNAIETAIKAETDYNEHMQRLRITEGLMQSVRCNNCLGYGHHTHSCSTINPLAQVTHVQWQPKVCSYCKNSGHVRSECKALQPRILNRNQDPNQPRGPMKFGNPRGNFITPHNNEIICRYCKKPGHSLEQCRKRQYNNNRLGNRADNEWQGNQANNRGNRINNNIRPQGIIAESGNRERAQRDGAPLNERPHVRLITQEATPAMESQV